MALLGLAIAAYVLCLTHLSFRRYDHYAATYDLAVYDQAVWLISRGHSPFLTLRGLHLLADHFTPILFLFAPVYWIWASPKSLLLLQTIALGLSAIPVYCLVRHRLQSAPFALGFACIYLLYPALQWMNTFDFHPDVLATPLLLGAFYWAQTEKWKPCLALLCLALLTKEIVGLTVFLMGAFVFLKHRRQGFFIMTLGGAGVAVALATICYFNDGTPSAYSSLYSRYGDSPFSIIKNILLHPISTASNLNAEDNRVYATHLLLPLLFLPLAAPEVLALAAPGVLSSLLSYRPGMHTIFLHYTATVTPFTIIAAVVGFQRVRNWGNRFSTGMVVLFLAAAALEATRWSPWRIKPFPLAKELSQNQAQEINRMLRHIPEHAAVSAQVVLTSHLSHRMQVYTFPNPFYQASWGNSAQTLHQQMGEEYAPCPPEQLAERIRQSSIEYVMLCPLTATFPLTSNYPYFAVMVLQNPSFGIVDIGSDCVLLRRNANHQRGLRGLERASGVRIKQPSDIGKAFRIWARCRCSECEKASYRAYGSKGDS